MGAYLGKGTYWQLFHKLDSRETSLLNAANHFKIFLIEFEIYLYEHLYFLYIRNPQFPIVAFISMFWQLNPLDPKGLPSNMRYFPRISQNSLKIPQKCRANTKIQSLTNAYLFIKTK